MTTPSHQAKFIEQYPLKIYEHPERGPLSLRVALGDVTVDDGTVYNISQNGLRISISKSGKVWPELFIDLTEVVRHMVTELHNRS